MSNRSSIFRMTGMRCAWPFLLALLLILGGAAWAAWDKSKPAGTTPVSQADDFMRANWEALEGNVGVTGIGNEHQFTSSDTECYHLEGSARAYVGADTDKSAADSKEGRLYLATDNNKLYYGNSDEAWTQFRPKPNVIQSSIVFEVPLTTTSTTFENCHFSLNATIITTGGDLLITCTLTGNNGYKAKRVYFNLKVDTTLVTTAGWGLAMIDADTDGVANGAMATITMVRRVTGLSAGSHTVYPQWKVDADSEGHLATEYSHTVVVQEI